MNPIIRDVLDVYDARRESAEARGFRNFVTQIEKKSGYERSVVNRWRQRRSNATIAAVCAIAGALGYRLVLEKIETNEVP